MNQRSAQTRMPTSLLGKEVFMFGRIRFFVAAFFSLLLIQTLASCTATYKVDTLAMVPSIDSSVSAASTGSRLAKSIVLGSVGGSGTLHMPGLATVSASEFRKALELSLSRAGFLASNQKTGRYRLDAFLIEIIQRDAGPTFNVDAVARYKITNTSGAVLLQEVITSETSANVGEIAAGGSAYMERVIKSNIYALLRRLNQIDRRRGG